MLLIIVLIFALFSIPMDINSFCTVLCCAVYVCDAREICRRFDRILDVRRHAPGPRISRNWSYCVVVFAMLPRIYIYILLAM